GGGGGCVDGGGVAVGAVRGRGGGARGGVGGGAGGAGPDAGFFGRPPIDEVVPAFGARPRMVGNLVGRQACARADRLRRVIERAGDVVVGNDELARRMQRGKRRVLLDGELIEREMLARLDSGAFELGGPDLRRLA